MTSSAKTSHVPTKTEIHFIAQDHSYTQEVSMHSVSTGQCEQVCFSGGHFADPVMSRLIQASAIGKVNYIKSNRLLCLLLLIQDGQL